MIRRILVPVDLGPGSTELVRWAAWHARGDDARVVLLHVVDVGALLWDALPPQYARGQLEHGLRVGAQAALDKLAGEASFDPAVRVEVGPAAERIITAAREMEADLIVLGSHGGRAESSALGGTADRILRGSPCPVFLVPVPS